MATVSEPRSCANCKKPEIDLSKPLKLCSRCKSTLYCSRDCQKADWKIHKRSCGTSAPYRVFNTSTGRSSGPFSTPFMDPFADDALQLDTLPEKAAFARIIDCYRMRMEDELTYGGETSGLYIGKDPLKDFQKFLSKAERRGGCLPTWWSEEKSAACQEQGMRGVEWSNLDCKVKESDIQDRYGDPLMPLKLRVRSEKIIGHKIISR